ncbi:MAG: M16 family metallopeptidase [Actinomycetota bacterium]
MLHRSSIVLSTVILFSFIVLPASAARAPKKSKPAAADKITVPNIPYEKYKLKNGLEVILSENHRLPLVAVYVLYHVGPANERPGRTGFAHLFEHFMFDGSLHVGQKAHFKLLEAAGARQINGTTDLDDTKYFETVPSDELEKALWLESDRMGFILETLTGAKLANQRDVVRNERRQKIENQPYGLAEEGLYHLLFPKEHPYHADVIGSHADIEAARLDDVRDFFKYYAPNNASLAIVGDIDKARTKDLVEKYFGSLPAGEPVPKIDVTTPVIRSEQRAVVTDKVQLPRVYMAWHTDPIFHTGDADEQILAQILGGSGKSSRLYRQLVYKKELAQGVSAQQTSLELGSVFTMQATARPGVKPEELEAAMDQELAAIQKDGPTEAELNQARNVIEARLLRRLEMIGGERGVAGILSRYNHYLGDPGFLPKDIQRYENVTVRSIQEVARQKLTQNSRLVLYCVSGPKVINDVPRRKAEQESGPPSDEKRAAFLATQEWRRDVPKRGPASQISLPVPEAFKLGNGLSVLLVERHDLPVITADLFTLSGSAENPPEEPGLAAFTAKMLEAGTTKRSALQIAADTEQIGAQISTGSTADWSGILMRCLKQNVDGAFDLLSDLALHPAFAPADVERVRNEQLTLLLEDRDNPTDVALRAFYQAAYGDKHPYGHMELGTSESVKKVTREDLVRFWKTGYIPSKAVLAITGDMTQAEARALAEQYFGSWKGGKSKPTVPPPFPGKVTRQVLIVDRPGAPQTALVVGGIGVPRSSPDYIPTEIMNTILGGLVSARLNMNLREKHGYTYAAFSQFVYRRGPGPFFARTSVRADVTIPALQQLFYELNRIRTDPLSPDEVQHAKDAMSRSLPERFQTTQQTSRSIADLFIYSLPLDFFRSLPDKIRAVDVAAVRLAAEKHIQPNSTVVVAVGDRNKIESGIKEMNLGKIEIVNTNGRKQPSQGSRALRPLEPVTRASSGLVRRR